MIKKFIKNWWYHNVHGYDRDLEKAVEYIRKHEYTYEEIKHLKDMYPKVISDVTKEGHLIKIHLNLNEKMD